MRSFPYNSVLRFVVEVDTAVEQTRQNVVMNTSEAMTMTTVGRVHITVDGERVVLSIYWLDLNGGGLFLPFRDATCTAESYGEGRYLLDNIKGSDPLLAPGESGWRRLTLDFNYASNPSCASNDRWVCPLAPLESGLRVAIHAGEMNYRHAEECQ